MHSCGATIHSEYRMASLEFVIIYKAGLDNPELVIFNICLLAKQNIVYTVFSLNDREFISSMLTV